MIGLYSLVVCVRTHITLAEGTQRTRNASSIVSSSTIDKKPVKMELDSHRSSTEYGSDATRMDPEQGHSQDQEQAPAPPKDDKDLLKPTESPFLSTMNKYWVWEIISCLGSLIALVSIVGVLVNYNGKPIPNWPYGITINSVLSWITQIFSAFMLGTVAACLGQNAWVHFNTGDRPLSNINSYHSASRGAWGCITFLSTARTRYSLPYFHC